MDLETVEETIGGDDEQVTNIYTCCSVAASNGNTDKCTVIILVVNVLSQLF